MVEVGYSIESAVPAARATPGRRCAVLLARAEAEPDVRTFRATVSPDNVASRDLVLAHGLVEVGEQEDDEDGLEIIYELPVDGRPTSTPMRT